MDPSAYLYLSVILASLDAVYVLQKRKKRLKRRFWVRPWIRRRDCATKETIMELHKELISDGDITEFRSTLRMNPEVYQELLEMIRPGLTKMFTNFRTPISPDTRLAITLRYLALGEGFRTLSQLFRVGISTTRLIVRETCRVVAMAMQDRFMKTPRTLEEWLDIACGFENRWQFPNCIGCVDGKHIWISAPSCSGTFYYNYKGFFSIVLLGIVDSDYKFTYLDIGAEGKASDGGIWAKSSFQQHLVAQGNPLNIPNPRRLPGIQERIPFFLIGDDAFRLGSNIMKPYSGCGLTKKQLLFNYRICRCRRVVENSFGILASRFKVYKRTLEVSPEFVTDIVLATCILHNFLREKAASDYTPTIALDQEMADGQVVPGAWRQEIELEGMERSRQKNSSEYAKKIRNALSDYFLTPAGEVPWQYQHSFD